MAKINRLFFGFFLALLWPSAFMLCAEEPSPDAVLLEKVVSATSNAASAEINSLIETVPGDVRDPFAKALISEVAAPIEAAAPTAAPEAVGVLQGIGFGSKDAYAVIGGEVFYQGDEKQGIKLIEVRRREVDILRNGEKVTIPLFEGEDLRKARDRAKKKRIAEKALVDQPSETPSFLPEREQPQS